MPIVGGTKDQQELLDMIQKFGIERKMPIIDVFTIALNLTRIKGDELIRSVKAKGEDTDMCLLMLGLQLAKSVEIALESWENTESMNVHTDKKMGGIPCPFRPVKRSATCKAN